MIYSQLTFTHRMQPFMVSTEILVYLPQPFLAGSEPQVLFPKLKQRTCLFSSDISPQHLAKYHCEHHREPC